MKDCFSLHTYIILCLSFPTYNSSICLLGRSSFLPLIFHSSSRILIRYKNIYHRYFHNSHNHFSFSLSFLSPSPLFGLPTTPVFLVPSFFPLFYTCLSFFFIFLCLSYPYSHLRVFRFSLIPFIFIHSGTVLIPPLILCIVLLLFHSFVFSLSLLQLLFFSVLAYFLFPTVPFSLFCPPLPAPSPQKVLSVLPECYSPRVDPLRQTHEISQNLPMSPLPLVFAHGKRLCLVINLDSWPYCHSFTLFFVCIFFIVLAFFHVTQPKDMQLSDQRRFQVIFLIYFPDFHSLTFFFPSSATLSCIVNMLEG